MKYTYKTSTVCAQTIKFDINDDVITNIEFIGGCNGNLKAIAALVDGWTVAQITEKLQGNTCGRRPTSCADQLVKAVNEAYEKNKK